MLQRSEFLLPVLHGLRIRQPKRFYGMVCRIVKLALHALCCRLRLCGERAALFRLLQRCACRKQIGETCIFPAFLVAFFVLHARRAEAVTSAAGRIAFILALLVRPRRFRHLLLQIGKLLHHRFQQGVLRLWAHLVVALDFFDARLQA